MTSPAATAFVLVAALGLSACCGGGSHTTSDTSESGGTPRAAAKKPIGKATVAAPPFPDGAPRRAIILSAPRFGAPEVARLTNGTQLRVMAEHHGGFLEVEWDGGEGFVHHDVVKR